MAKCVVCGAETNYWYDPCDPGDPMCYEMGGYYCGKHFPQRKKSKADLALAAAIAFMKHAQMDYGSTEPGQIHKTIFTALGIETDDNGTPIDSSLRKFFDAVVVPWVNSEVEAGNMKEGDKYGVMISAAPKNVKIFGTINGREGPLSSAAFGAVSAAATKAIGSSEFEPFEIPLFADMVLEFG